MNYTEALQYAKNKRVVLAKDFYSLAALQERARLFTVSHAANVTQIKNIKLLLEKSLITGSTFQDFRNEVVNRRLDIGISLGQLQTIYRNNLQSAYNAGRLVQQVADIKVRPFLMYDAILDDRTRNTHRALHGLIFDLRTELKLIRRLTPPRDHQCRCRWIALTEAQAKKHMEENKKNQAKRTELIEQNPSPKGWRGGIMTTEQMQDFYNDSVAEVINSTNIKKQLKTKFDTAMQPIATITHSQNADTKTLKRIFAGFKEGLLANRYYKGTFNDINAMGALTTAEAAALQSHIQNSTRLNEYINTGQNDINKNAHVALLSAIFAVRRNYFLPIKQKQALLMPLQGQNTYKVGDKVSFGGLPVAHSSLQGETQAFVFEKLSGDYLICNNLTELRGAVVFNSGQEFIIKAVFFDEIINNKKYDTVYKLEFKQKLEDKKIASKITAGNKFWLQIREKNERQKF